jgi:ubiquinone/menaquinone biosynthesis C-methylase UbiE
MKTATPVENPQKQFDFSAPSPRPFLANLPAKIDTYEAGVAEFFRLKTGLDYYLTIDQIVDFVVNTGRLKVIDLLTDTAVFAFKLAGRKSFQGRIHSFDSNITLLERAKQRAAHLSLNRTIEFKHIAEPRFPLPDGFGDLAFSFFDLHRHPAEEYLKEAMRTLIPDGHMIIAEMLEPKAARTALLSLWKRWHLQYIKRGPAEAYATYFDREEIIQLLFKVGFRQVIVQGLNVPESPDGGVFSLIAATK